MFWFFMILLFVILVDFKLFLGLFRFAGLFVLGMMLGTYLFGCALQWAVS